MIINDIIFIDKRKCKIVCDDVTFPLYNSEIHKYNLEIGKDLSEDIMQDIKENVLYKRGRERALYLLESMERTEHQIVQKLKEGYYPIDVIERIIAFLKQYGFIDDEEYVRRYINTHLSNKSMKMIEQDLLKKGIKKNIYERYVIRDDELEEAQIESLLSKRKYMKYKDNPKEKNRIINYILRRGYTYEAILKVANSI